MSWYAGSHVSSRSSAVQRICRWVASRLERRLRWVTRTPRGVPVEPEVYWMIAVSSPPAANGPRSKPPTPSRRSASASSAAHPCPAPPVTSRRPRTVALSATKTRGRQSAITPRTRSTSNAFPPKPASEGSGTGTAPSQCVLSNHSTNASELGRQRSTRSPGPMPSRVRLAARARARATSAATVNGTAASSSPETASTRSRHTRSGAISAQATRRWMSVCSSERPACSAAVRYPGAAPGVRRSAPSRPAGPCSCSMIMEAIFDPPRCVPSGTGEMPRDTSPRHLRGIVRLSPRGARRPPGLPRP